MDKVKALVMFYFFIHHIFSKQYLCKSKIRFFKKFKEKTCVSSCKRFYAAMWMKIGNEADLLINWQKTGIFCSFTEDENLILRTWGLWE